MTGGVLVRWMRVDVVTEIGGFELEEEVGKERYLVGRRMSLGIWYECCNDIQLFERN